MKLKKGVPLIDQHDQFGFWGKQTMFELTQ